MSEKKDKWYLPDEFKSEYWKGRGFTQIGIGIVITICGIFYQQNVIFIIGGIAWTIFGVILVARDSIGEQENKNIEDKNYEEDAEDEEEEESDNEVEAEMKDLSIKILLEENRKLVDKVEKLEQKNKEKGKKK